MPDLQNQTFFITYCAITTLLIATNAFYLFSKIRKRRGMVHVTQETFRNNAQPDSVTVRRKAIGARRHRILTARSMILGARRTQQDAVFVSDPVSYMDVEEIMLLGVLCDGMGGMKGGDRASSLAVDMLRKEFDGAEEIDDIPQFFRQAVQKINEEVYFLQDASDTAGQSGTTLVAVIIRNSQLFWVSVGDSRIYIFRKGEFSQLTRDHNYMLSLKEMVDKGEISEEDALKNPSREALISYIGMEALEIVDIGLIPFELLNGDIVLMCSDGLTKALTDRDIARVIVNHFGDLEETARQLPLAAYEANARTLDNTSVVMFQFIE